MNTKYNLQKKTHKNTQGLDLDPAGLFDDSELLPYESRGSCLTTMSSSTGASFSE